MSQIGELSVGLGLDLSPFNQQLQQLEQRKFTPLLLKLEVDKQTLNKQLDSLKLNPIAVQLIPDVELFKRQLRTLKVATTVAVEIDSKSLQAKLKAVKVDPINVELKLQTGQIAQQIKKLGVSSLSVDLKLNTNSVEQQIRTLRNQVATTVVQPVEFRYLNPKAKTETLTQKVQVDTEGLEEAIAKSVEKGTRKSRKKGLFEVTAELPGNIFSNTLRGFNEGITYSYAAKFAQGSIKTIEKELGQGLDDIGQKLSEGFSKVGKFAGNRLAQRLGFEEGLADLNKFVAQGTQQTRELFNEIIDEKALERKFSVVEVQIGKLIDDLVALKDVQTQLKNLQGVGGAVADLGSVPNEGLTRRRQRIFKEEADAIRERTKNNTAPPEEVSPSAEFITLVSGGFAGKGGKSSHMAAEKAQILLGDRHHVKAIENTATDTFQSIQALGPAKWLANAGAKIGQQNLSTGANPDAVRMAEEAYRLYQQTQKPVRLMGYSAGGMVAHDAAEILKNLNVPVRAVGLGTPHWGVRSSLSARDYQTFLREQDGVTTVAKGIAPIAGDLDERKTNYSPGFGHDLGDYLGERASQIPLLKFLEGNQYQERDKRVQQPGVYDLPDIGRRAQGQLENTQFLLSSPFKNPLVQNGLLQQNLQGIQAIRKELSQNLRKLDKETQAELTEILQVLLSAQKATQVALGQRKAPKQKSSAVNFASPLEKLESDLNELMGTVETVLTSPDQAGFFAEKGVDKSILKAVGTKREQIQSLMQSASQEDSEKLQAFLSGLSEIEQVVQEAFGSTATTAAPPEKPAVDLFDRSYQNLVQKTAQAAGLKPLPEGQVPAVVGSDDLPKTANGAYTSTQNQVKLPKEKLEQFKKILGRQITELTEDELTEAAKQFSTLGHEVFHGAQYGFSGKSRSQLIADGGVKTPAPKVSDRELATFAQARGMTPEQAKKASLEQLTAGSVRSITNSEAFKSAPPAQQKATKQASQDAERGAYAYGAKLLTSFLDEARASSDKVGVTVADIIDKAVANVAKDVEQQFAQLTDAQKSLQSYSDEVLVEINRITGGQSQKTRGALIEQLAGLENGSLEKAIATVKPFVENGAQGQIVKRPEKATADEQKVLSQVKEAEKRINDTLRVVQSAEGKRRQQIIEAATNEINQTLSLLEGLKGQVTSKEAIAAGGSARGRLKGLQGEFDKAKTAEPIPVGDLVPRTAPKTTQGTTATAKPKAATPSPTKAVEATVTEAVQIPVRVQKADTSALEKQLKAIQEKVAPGLSIRSQILTPDISKLDTRLKEIQEKVKPGLSIKSQFLAPDTSKLDASLKVIQEKFKPGLSIKTQFLTPNISALDTRLKEIQEKVKPGLSIKTQFLVPDTSKLEARLKAVQEKVAPGLSIHSKFLKADTSILEAQIKAVREQLGATSLSIHSRFAKADTSALEAQLKAVQEQLNSSLSISFSLQLANVAETKSELEALQSQFSKGLNVQVNLIDVIDFEQITNALADAIAAGFKEGQARAAATPRKEQPKTVSQPTTGAQTVQASPQPPPVQVSKKDVKPKAELVEAGVEKLQAEVEDSLNMLLGGLEAPQINVAPPKAAQNLESDLNKYTAEVLKELNRVSGLGTKGNKEELVKNLMGLDPADLKAAIDAVEPLIERGPKGGQKLTGKAQPIVKQPPKLDDVGLARVRPQLDFQKVYESLFKEAAKLSDVGLKPGDIPTLKVDDGKLKQLGVKALYEAKQNQIVISQALADLLSSSMEEIQEKQHLVADILHEARHALQLDFGRISLDDVASGQADFGVQTTSPQSASSEARSSAKQSVRAANRQVGGQLAPEQKKAIARAEVDAYEFEKRATPKAVQAIKAELSLPSSDAAQKTGGAVQQLAQVFQAGQGAATGFQKVLSGLENGLNGLIPGFGSLGTTLKNVVVGFVGFQVAQQVIPAIANFGKESLMASVRLSNFKTALDFASGSSVSGAKNLAFVRSEVERLRVPLEASIQGFTKLSASTRGTAVEGKATKELFTGISSAATVLGLSADEAGGALNALAQMASKGTVQAEELRGQLGERIPGAMSIAARAMGVTEKQLGKMMEQGQLMSEDFLPKFAKQLKSEFGDAAKDAAGNAQSAIFATQNAFLELKQGVGEGLQPAAVAVFNTLAEVMKGLAAVAPQLVTALAAVAIAAAVQVGPAIGGLIQNLILTKLATGTLTGALGALFQTLITSKAVMAGVGFFALIEGVKLFSAMINTELVQAWRNAADAAKNSSDRFKEALNPNQKPDKPESSGNPIRDYVDDVTSRGFGGGAGKLADDFLNNATLGFTGRLRKEGKFTGWQELEQQNRQAAYGDFATSQNTFLNQSQALLADLQGSGGGQFKQVDDQLTTAESNRRGLRARAEREFTAKGRAIPPELQQQIQAANAQINQLTEQRAELQKPFTASLDAVGKKIQETKSEIERLQTDPKERAQLIREGTTPAAREKELKSILKGLEDFKQKAEFTLASMKVDPVLALGAAFAELKLKLDEAARSADQFATRQKTQVGKQQLEAFSTDPDAARKAAVGNAQADLAATGQQIDQTKAAISTAQQEVGQGRSQQVLSEFNLNENSSQEEIDRALASLGDSQENQGKKRVVEGLKTLREAQANLDKLENTRTGQQLTLKQATQDLALGELDRKSADQSASLQRRSNDRQVSAVRSQLAQFSPGLSQREAAVQAGDAAIQSAQGELAETQQAQTNNADQLGALKEKYAQGAISAEEFHKRERDLITQSSELSAKAAQAELAIKQTVQNKILSLLDLEAQKREGITKRGEAAAAGRRALQQANVVRQRANRQITEEEAAIANADIQKSAAETNLSATGQREEAATKNLQDLEKAFKGGGLAAEEFYKRQEGLVTQIAELRASKAQAQLQIEEAIAAKIEATNRKIIRNFELSIKRAESAIKISQDNRAIARTQSRVARGIGGELTNEVSDNLDSISQTGSDLEATNQRTQLKQKELEFNRQMFKEGRRDRLEFQETEIRLLQELSGLKVEAVEKEASLTLGMLKELRSARVAYAQEVSQLQQNELDLQSRLIDGQKQLVDAYGGLKKAQNDAALSASEGQLQAVDQALQLFNESSKPKSKSQERREKREQQRVAKTQLKELGFGTSEKEILGNKARIEDEIAQQKAIALNLELEMQQRSLEIEEQKFKLAQAQAKLQAEMLVLESKRKVEDANSAVDLAKQGVKEAKTPAEKRAAQAVLERAELNRDIAQRQLGGAVQGLIGQDAISRMGEESFALQRQSLDVSANAKRSEFFAGDRLREMKQSLDLAGKGRNSNAGVAGILYGGGTQLGGLDPSRFSQMTPDTQKFLNSVLKGDGLTIPGVQARNQEVSQRVAQSSTESAQMTSQFKILATAVLAAASKPTAINVSSPQPVQDAAEVHRQVNKNLMMNSSSF